MTASRFYYWAHFQSFESFAILSSTAMQHLFYRVSKSGRKLMERFFVVTSSHQAFVAKKEWCALDKYYFLIWRTGSWLLWYMYILHRIYFSQNDGISSVTEECFYAGIRAWGSRKKVGCHQASYSETPSLHSIALMPY